MVCNFNKETLKNDISSTVKNRLINSGIFEPQSNNSVKVKDVSQNFHQPIISSINSEYKDNIVSLLGDVVTIHPSEDLINKYFGQFELPKIEGKETTYNKAVKQNLPKDQTEAYSQSIYNTIYDYTAEKGLKDKVDEILSKLPTDAEQIAKLLKKTGDENTSKELGEFITKLKTSEGDKQKLISQLNMIFSVSSTLLDLKKQSIAAISEPNADERLKKLYTIKKVVDGYEDFVKTLQNLSNAFDTPQGIPSNLKSFFAQVNGALATPGIVKANLQKNIGGAVAEIAADYNSPLINSKIKDLNDRIAAQEKIKNSPSTDAAKVKANKEISRLTKQKDEYINSDKIPTASTINNIFSGNYKDADVLSMNVESLIVNGHPIVATIASILKDLNIEINKEMLIAQNAEQKRIDLLTKATQKTLRNQADLWAPQTDLVTITEYIQENKKADGSIEYLPKQVTTKMHLSSYDPSYLTEFSTLQAFQGFYKFRANEAKNKGDESELNFFNDKLESATTSLKNFINENSQKKYKDEVYQMWDMLDNPITLADGTTSSIRKLKGDIFQEIENSQNFIKQADRSTQQDLINSEQAVIDQHLQEIRELKNTYDSQGNKKTGIELDIANTLQEYSKKQREYGDWILDDAARGVFEADLQILKLQKSQGQISEEEFSRQKSLMTTTEIDPKFFDLLEGYSDKITEYAQKLITIPELAARLNLKDQFRDNFQKLRQTTQPFRDDDGKIQGIDFETQRPEVKKQIKDIQEAYEKLKSESEGIKNLSITDNNRLQYLNLLSTSKEGISLSEKDELSSLLKKQADIKKVYNENKLLIDNYLDAIRDLSTISSSIPTHYYIEQKGNILSSIKSSAEIKDKADKILQDDQKFAIDNTIYSLLDGKWYKEENNLRTYLSEHTDGATEAFQILSTHLANRELKNSDWWRENHYQSFQWDQEQRAFIPIEKPIYIWMEQNPKDPKWMKKDQPAFKYKKYKIKKEFENENYDYIHKYIPAPKAGKFVNKRYNDLKNAKDDTSKAHFKILEEHRADYHKDQKVIPQHQFMGDVLPGIIKSEDENAVEFTNDIKGHLIQMKKNAFGRQDEDSSYLMGGSIKTKQQKEIPLRFTGYMPADKQSSNIAGMMLMFKYSVKQWQKLSEKEYFFKSVQDVVKDLPVTEVVQRAGNFSLKNLTKNKEEKEYQQKQTEKSNLSKTVDNALNMFVYGENTRGETIIDTPLGKIDMQKTSSTLMRYVSNNTFIMAIASPIKNTISTKVQSIINADNIQNGFYSPSDLAKAQGKVTKYFKNFFEDYQKVGNKSLIGQMIQYFQVVPSHSYEEFMHKTQFTLLKSKAELAAGPKHFSEFEVLVTQFLAVAEGNKVMNKEGKMISLAEAYELKNGNLQLKEGIQFSEQQEKQFIKKLADINANIAGAYNQDEASYLSTHWLGKLGEFMNKYIARMFANRYAGERFNIGTGNITKGFYRDGLAFIRDLVIEHKLNLSNQWHSMNDRERANALKFGKELSAITALALAGALMGSGDDRSELRKNTPIYNFMLGTLIGVQNETDSFLKPTDLVRKMEKPFMAVNQIKQIVKTLNLALETSYGDEDAYYKNSTGLRDGLHDKGDSKLLVNALRLIGYTGVTLNPDQLVVNNRMVNQLK